MMIERACQRPDTRCFDILGRSKREAARVAGAARRDFVILGRSDAKRRGADPRIHAVTSAEGRKRLRIPDELSATQGAVICTTAERRDNGMDPRVCAASLRSLLRPRMTKNAQLGVLPLRRGKAC
ncbi:hypothetical protein CK224_26615 [Mesorhizobium sp. WSM3862]|nr:hypothetical protein CK224_26615 [Mesorhizobium sp. WSM3862]